MCNYTHFYVTQCLIHHLIHHNTSWLAKFKIQSVFSGKFGPTMPENRKTDNFFEKSGSVTFYLLQCPSFILKIRKIVIAVFQNFWTDQYTLSDCSSTEVENTDEPFIAVKRSKIYIKNIKIYMKYTNKIRTNINFIPRVNILAKNPYFFPSHRKSRVLYFPCFHGEISVKFSTRTFRFTQIC